MTGYILSILGIVVAGVFIDIVIPSGTISKYIKGMYSIFVVAVLLSPIMKLMTKTHDFTIKFNNVEVSVVPNADHNFEGMLKEFIGYGEYLLAN